MPEQNITTWQSKQRHQNNQPRLSVGDFLTLLREHLMAITIARENLQRMYIRFNTQAIIQPDQCTCIIDLARTMDRPVQNLSHFLDQKTHLPIAVLPLRYQLTTKLLTIKDLLWMVLALVGSLRSPRQTDPRENAMTRHKMLQKLDTLLQESENIMQFTQIISDQTYFQENGDTKALERMPLSKGEEDEKGGVWNVSDISLYRKV